MDKVIRIEKMEAPNDEKIEAPNDEKIEVTIFMCQ
jgi:hypothetical protein